MTMMQRMAYEAVAEITEAKTGITVPPLAHMHEIRNSLSVELTEALRELCRCGVLSVNLDKNKNPMFAIRQKQ